MTRARSSVEAAPAAAVPRTIADVPGQMPLPFAGKADVGLPAGEETGPVRPVKGKRGAPKVESAASWLAEHPIALEHWTCDWCAGRPVAWFVGDRTVCSACARARGYVEEA